MGESSVATMEMVKEGQNQPKIALKRRKYQEFVEKGEDDRISALPDCLLLEILSRLPSTKAAIRAGTLSKRWEHLWTLVPTLIFKHNDDKHSQSEFVSLVDKTLTQCRQLKLKKFDVMFINSYIFVHESQVNNWIRYALRCNVEELNLVLWIMESEDFLVDQFLFTGSCFTDLRLGGCKLNPTGAISWKNLKRLWISMQELDEELIENILSGSPVLETLVLDDCHGYRRLDITSKSVKNLVFSAYMEHGVEYVDLDDIIVINAPNILSLTIEGDLLLWKLLLVNVSSLVEANLDYTDMGHYEISREEAEEEMLKGYLLNLRNVKELKIRDFCDGVMSRLEAKGFDFPSNMKFVEGTVSLFHSDSVESEEW